jgi:hypothetical protein
MMDWLKSVVGRGGRAGIAVAAGSPLHAEPSLGHLYFALHGLASAAVSAWLAWSALPVQHRAPRWPAYALLYCFAFFIPVLGVLATVLAVQVAQRYPQDSAYRTFCGRAPCPSFPEVQREATERSDLRAGTRGAFSKTRRLPLETRLRVLVACSPCGPRRLCRLLQGLLADPSEDIRLLAYSMVDAWEKDLTQQIQQARATACMRRARAKSARRWSMPCVGWPSCTGCRPTPAWPGATCGAYALEQAQVLCEDVLVLDSYIPSIWQLYAKVC